MNVARILELADVIEKVPHVALGDAHQGPEPVTDFNMSTFHCGTAGCIAGWAAHLYGNGRGVLTAEKFLGISSDDGDELFIPAGLVLEDITPAQAATTLRKLVATGKVDWSHVETQP